MCSRKNKSGKHKKMHSLYDAQGGICFYCRLPCVIICEVSDQKVFIPEQATIEHRRPRSLGGDYNAPENVVMACSECNNIKGNGPVYALLTPLFSHQEV